MAKAQDILLDDEYDLALQDITEMVEGVGYPGSDLVVGDNLHTLEQHIDLFLMTAPGDWKQNPTDGVALITALHAPENEWQDYIREIQTQLESDIFTNVNVDVSNGMANAKVSASEA